MYKKLIHIAALVILFTSCNVFKRSASYESSGSVSKSDVIRFTQAFQKSEYQNVNFDKANFKVKKGKQNFNFGGRLHLKKDEFIHISLTHLFGIEVFKAVFLPNKVYMVSKLTREYYEFSYPELSKVAGISYDDKLMNFESVQSLIAYDFSQIKISRSDVVIDTQIQASKRISDMAKLLFTVIEYQSSLQVENVALTTENTQYSVNVAYNIFKSSDYDLFPHHLKLTVGDQSNTNISTDIEVKQLSFDDDFVLNLDFVKKLKRAKLK